MKQYNKQNISRAKQLRKNMTPWERKLWYEYLRNYPVRFQRQKAIGEYIVDFYCAKAKLVIELDGSEHYEEKQQNKDALRTENLKQMDLRVVRICNRDIDKNFRGVCEHIDIAVRGSLPPVSCADSPLVRGGLPCEGNEHEKSKESNLRPGLFRWGASRSPGAAAGVQPFGNGTWLHCGGCDL